MATGTNPLVLIVEDDESVRTMLQRALAMSYEVETINDGLQAMERLGTAPTPDLIICDIMMPGADGLEVARKVKGDPELRQIPIIFLTAKATAADVIRGIQSGARHYITKPFKITDLLAKVQKVLEK